jgi:hypothetical protein
MHMSKLSEKLAAIPLEEETEEVATSKQEAHDELKKESFVLIAELNGLVSPVFPDSLEEFDEEIAEEFVATLKDAVNFLKGEETTTKKKVSKERKPLKRPDFKQLGTGLKRAARRIP